jgi:AraC family transcriptional activator of pobA
LFKKLGNKTPLQFIQFRLLLEAHRLLKYSDKSISDVGYELGFNDIQAFSRFFKNLEGISPNDYRLS